VALSQVHAGTGVLDRRGVNYASLSRRAPEGGYDRYGQDDEDGGVGQRYRASSTLHGVRVGLDAADSLMRYERTGHEYIRVRPLF
jgi:hypothetical protein